MQVTPQAITVSFLKHEIQPLLGKPLELGPKVEGLAERLVEMSIQDLEKLNQDLRGKQPKKLASTAALVIVQQIVDSVMKAKPQLIKLEKAEQLFAENKLDETLIVLNGMDNTFEEQVQEMRNKLAEKYIKDGKPEKARNVHARRAFIMETPAETVRYEVGRSMVHEGMDNLRSTYPDRQLLTHSQVDGALAGLHKMSAISTGRMNDASHDNKSIELLKEELAAAEKIYHQDRDNYEHALTTGNRENVVSALAKKQKTAQDILLLKQVLHSKGVDQSEPGNREEILNNALQKSGCILS